MHLVSFHTQTHKNIELGSIGIETVECTYTNNKLINVVFSL